MDYKYKSFALVISLKSLNVQSFQIPKFVIRSSLKIGFVTCFNEHTFEVELETTGTGVDIPFLHHIINNKRSHDVIL